jgi:hypothetical protein
VALVRIFLSRPAYLISFDVIHMMKLNGWKRIGIIASVVWILGAGVYTYDSEMDRANDYITSTFLNCESNWVGAGDAWGFAYLVLFIVRWVKRGFVQSA